ncbi:amidase family protein [Nocardiopsis xinjiangensis]|uniref:amidase family protein n=1 Tax=Nocardiopsis xinjiangensis TaxID=124285 RepID=UPI000348A654
MRVDECLKHDAVGLAGLIREGQVGAGEALSAALARSEQVDPHINATVLPMHAEARRLIEEGRQGPLAGVPLLIKDLFQDYAGFPTSAGDRAMRRVPAARHSEVVRRWLQAGLVPFAKTNVPEFGAKAVTEPREFGPARNPWNTGHTPGGASGGSAAKQETGPVRAGP